MDLIIDIIRKKSQSKSMNTCSAAQTRMIVPDNQSHAADSGECIELLESETVLSRAALLFGSCPIIAMRLKKADPHALQLALGKALGVHRILAGRLCIKSYTNWSAHVKLSDEGVPFMVVSMPETSAPIVLQECELLDFGDWRNPRNIARGREPLMTVKLSIYQDGSAILAMTRSHSVADGSYMWKFIDTWGSAARGEVMPVPISQERGPLRKHVVGMNSFEEMQQVQEAVLGERLKYKIGLQEALMRGFQFMDMLFFAGLSKATSRTRIFFSHADVARIKKMATPPVGSKGDGWVTTQEALAAHILLALGRVILPTLKKTRNPPRAGCFLTTDLRKKFGLPANFPSGMCVGTIAAVVDDPLAKSLPELAGILHDTVKEFTVKEAELWFSSMCTACKYGMVQDWFIQMEGKKGKDGPFDLLLRLNNQTKREYPDFGLAGGVPTVALTNAGPSLLYPADGGIELFLEKDSFCGAETAKVEEAISTIRRIP